MSEPQATGRFYDLVWPQRSVVLRSALILARNAGDAEDLAQDTLLKAFRNIGRFREGTEINAWLLAILRNTWIDRLRARSTSAANERLEELAVEPEDPSATPVPADPAVVGRPAEILDRFADQQIIDALQRLPEEIRWTLLLVDVEGMSHPEAATVLDVPAGTVKSRAHRGRAMLREMLLPLARDRRLIRD